MTLFSLENVDFHLPSNRLINKLNLTINQNQVTALIGCNGSGKSTLLKLLAIQAKPTAGKVRFMGQDLSCWKVKELAQTMAYLPQRPPETDGLYVEELVALGRYPWHGPLGRQTGQDRNKINEAIANCGLENMRKRRVDTLSGGERQRVWIAMMLAQGAQTLLLDEPTSALDVTHQVEILSLLQKMSHERGLSVLIVLHDVNMAIRYCDHVVALNAGNIILDGPIEALHQADILSRIYGLPMQIIKTDKTSIACPA